MSALGLVVGVTSKVILEERHGASEVAEEDSIGMDCDLTASVSQPNNAEGDAHNDMGIDCNLVPTTPQSHPSFSPAEALDVSQAGSQGLDALSQGVTHLPSSPQLTTPSAFRLERSTGCKLLILLDSDGGMGS